MVTPTLLYTLQ
uniref:Uncharacterized protein n=1 Tax=Rhizophora mucronata TaxID=61149 RepID=A0A2P2PWD9_RHIMU